MTTPRLARVLVTFACLSLAHCGSSESAAPAAQPACTSVLRCGTRLNIAHRGGASLAPEETREAMASGVAAGADVLELDVHQTSDGVVVCMHDDTVDRTTDGTGKIKDKTFAELRALDAGYRFSTDGKQTFPFRGKGVVTATLEELLTEHPTRPFSIEIKQVSPSMVDAVIALLRKLGATDRVVVASFSDDTLAELRAKAPEIETSLGISEMLTLQNLEPADEATYRAPGRFLQAPVNTMDEAALALARARRLGLRVQVWTVDDRATMDRMLALGVDGVMTNDPSELHAAIAAQKP